ncbi:TPA: hypothetical protein ACVU5K_005008 [Vibrio parahaemolyticus]
MSKIKTRIDFKPQVPEILYKQAGARCSVPRCSNPTMGPFYDLDGAVNMGVACHIYSASENVPRGWGGKDADFISSEKNGLWCCQYHAALIDKKNGRDYPASTLFAWKELIEARTRKLMNDTPSPLGWIESIAIDKFASDKGISPNIELSRWSLIWGKNGVGKTALLEFAASISNAKYAERFSGNQNSIFETNVKYSTVDSFNKNLTLSIVNGDFKRLENGVECLLPPGDLEVIYCDVGDLRAHEHEDHIDVMQRVLNVDKAALMSLCSIGTKTLIPGEIKFEPGVVEDEDDWDYENDTYVTKPRLKLNEEPFYELYFKRKNSSLDRFVSFEQLSTSERAKLILDLQITKAREIAKQRLTLLLVEGLAVNFDKVSFRSLLNAVENENFQAIVSIPPFLDGEVIDKKQSTVCLQDHDYLRSWSLRVIS